MPMWSPLSSPHVTESQPCFINVQECLLLQINTQESKCKLLSEDLTLYRVLKIAYWLDYPIAHPEILAQNMPHCLGLGDNRMLFLKLFPQRLNGVNELILLVHLLDCFSYTFSVLLALLSFTHQLSDELGIFESLFYYLRNVTTRNSVFFSYISVQVLQANSLMDYIDLLRKAQFGT